MKKIEKILFFEDAFEHGVRDGRPRSIKDVVVSTAEQFGREVITAGRIVDALEILKRGDISMTVVHHSDFGDIEVFRANFPKMQYAGYSVALPPKDSPEGSADKEFYDEFARTYDYVLDYVSVDLPKIWGEEQ